MDCKHCERELGDKIIVKTKFSNITMGGQLHKGHIKIISKKHATDISELSDEELTGMTLDLKRASKVITELFRPDKLNFAMYGNWVSHLHWHIYPRYKDDPDWGQPPYLMWKVNGKRVTPPQLNTKPTPLNENQKSKLKEKLEDVFYN